VILDPDDHVLMQHFRTREGWEGWITPGGGIEGEETPREAALRELVEEVGVRDAVLVGPIWTRSHAFEWNGELISQQETFFLARLDRRVEAAGEVAVEILEAEGVVGHRWWDLGDLETSGFEMAPRNLVKLVRSLLRDGPPSEPIDAGV
jgi:8-oxo-dGTP pyrophosphatase MutT (NUDIX family)